VSRRLGLVVLLCLILALPAGASDAQTRPAKPRSSISQQNVPAPHGAPAKPRSTKVGGATRPPTPPKGAVCTHSVRSGESISRIAARYRVSRAALVSANQLINPHALRSGQRLSVPGCQPALAHGTAGETPGNQPDADGILIKRVGPRRILTSLVLGTPDFREERINLVWPVEGPVISTFGRRSRGWHAGIDITAEMGSQIYAAAAGTVVYSGWIRAYGQVVKIEHTNGFITLYAHNLANLVEVGEEVEAGQVIATVGRSGHTTGPHVHFEVRRDGKAYNPLHLLEPSDESPVFEDDVAASSSEHDSHE
jgi:murein DD-endopeptidase MepM/ murein hydrolase activator NlpD